MEQAKKVYLNECGPQNGWPTYMPNLLPTKVSFELILEFSILAYSQSFLNNLNIQTKKLLLVK